MFHGVIRGCEVFYGAVWCLMGFYGLLWCHFRVSFIDGSCYLMMTCATTFYDQIDSSRHDVKAKSIPGSLSFGLWKILGSPYYRWGCEWWGSPDSRDMYSLSIIYFVKCIKLFIVQLSVHLLFDNNRTSTERVSLFFFILVFPIGHFLSKLFFLHRQVYSFVCKLENSEQR